MRALSVTEVSRPEPRLYFGPDAAGFLDREKTLARFVAEKSYWLVSASFTGQPHSMPVWGIWQNAAFVFSTYPNSKKARNLKANPRASVHLGDPEALLVLDCEAEEITEDVVLGEFVEDYNAKYQ